MSKQPVKNNKNTRKPLNWRPWTFGVIVVTVLVAVVWILKPALWPSIPALSESAAAQNTFSVVADMSGLYPKVIRVKVGQPVTVQLTSLDTRYHNDGGGKHQFAIDELDVDIVAPPKGTVQATFTPTEAGEYEFYCDICCGGRANPSMVGQFVVEA